MREYNKRKAVVEHGHGDRFFVGDLVWKKNANPRKNKLAMAYDGPYYIIKILGAQQQAVEVSMDGNKHCVRSIEHICQYHRTIRISRGQNPEPHVDIPESSNARDSDLGVYPERPFDWSEAVAPEARRQLEQCVEGERNRRSRSSSLAIGSGDPELGAGDAVAGGNAANVGAGAGAGEDSLTSANLKVAQG